MSPKAKRGRPKSDAPRGYTFGVRLSPDEWAEVQKAATREQRPAAQWARIVILEAARR